MAALWIRTRRMTLPNTFRNINDLKAGIVPVLPNIHLTRRLFTAFSR